MPADNEKLRILVEKLENLYKRQDEFSREINLLRAEMKSLIDEKSSGQVSAPFKDTESEIVEGLPPLSTEMGEKEASVPQEYVSEASDISEISEDSHEEFSVAPTSRPARNKTDIERYIGENLISTMGIGVTVIGAGIGVKYSIDHDLISPAVRIILGYLLGGGLLILALKLKKGYKTYSAVILSGSMAIMYFITYAAYEFYGLLPDYLAFVIMVLVTVFTVLASIRYSEQVIAQIGLVGAYAVPFLLGESDSSVTTLLTYMAIINIGILVVSVKQYWRSLYYSSFILTWLIFQSWFASNYDQSYLEQVSLFVFVFFATFFTTFLVYKIRKRIKVNALDVILILANSFVFYGYGYAMLAGYDEGKYQGVFTVGTALIHFAIGLYLSKRQLVDKSLVELIMGLSLAFVTIAIPVQLHSNWVVILWAVEAVFLYRISHNRNAPFYRDLSVVLIFAAFIYLLNDWNAYNTTDFPTFFNIHFLNSLIFLLALGYIFQQSRIFNITQLFKGEFPGIYNIVIPVILILTTYLAFYLEIKNYWNHNILINQNNYVVQSDLRNFRSLWILNFSLLYGAVLSWVNNKYFKNVYWEVFCALLITTIILFLLVGIPALWDLKGSYMNENNVTWFNIGIRYVSYIFLGFALYILHTYRRLPAFVRKSEVGSDFLIHITILWVLSSELVTYMDLLESEQSDKLGLSILWGLYSVFLISIGIWKNYKELRVGAIVLFGVTLIKLFAYDIAHLDTISKTIVFLSLGGLLLVISFLYNKYRNKITDQSEM
jgi:uncharacterized membrane protein